MGASGQVGKPRSRLRAKREHLPVMLNLLRQVLREPTLPEAELSVLKQGELSNLEQAMSDPQTLATRAVNRRVNPYPVGDPRFVPSVGEEVDQVKSLTRDDIARLYRDYLGACEWRAFDRR